MRGDGAWWSLRPFLAADDANPKSDPIRQARQPEVAKGIVRAFEEDRAEGGTRAFGTEIPMTPGGSRRLGRHLAGEAHFMRPLGALRRATGAGNDVRALSGARDPSHGRPGVFENSARADLPVRDGDPETSIDFIQAPVRTSGTA